MPVTADKIKAFADELASDLASATGDARQQILDGAGALLPQDLRQHVFNGGHAKAKADAAAATTVLKAELATLKTEADTIRTELGELRKKSPDADAVRKDLEKKLAEKEAEHQKALGELRDTWKGDRLKTAQDQIEAALVSGGATKTAAKLNAILAVQGGRVKVDEQTGDVTVYAADGATPLALAAGKTAAQALAEGIVKALPPEDRAGTSGAGAGEGSGGGAGTQGKTYFDGIRESVKGTAVPEADRTHLDALAFGGR